MAKNKKQNVENLKELKKSSEYKKENDELKQSLYQATKTVEKMMKESGDKDEEITHLKSLLEQSVPILFENKKPQQKISIDLSPEEEIAEIQLQKLKEISKQRALTLEETKIYDLLVKNKRLSQKQSTINVDRGNYRDVTEAELIQIANKDEQSQ